jgi:hypothetical protein
MAVRVQTSRIEISLILMAMAPVLRAYFAKYHKLEDFILFVTHSNGPSDADIHPQLELTWR